MSDVPPPPFAAPLPSDRGPGTGASTPALAHRTVTVAAIVLGLALLVLLVYVTASVLFLVFGALLIAAIFSGLARLLMRTGMPRPAALLLVYLLTFALIAAPIAWGGFALVEQFNDLLAAVRDQAESLLRTLGGMGLPVDAESVPTVDDLGSVLPQTGGIVSSVGQALFGALGVLGNFFVLLFLAIFVSWQPGLYRDGIVSLFPRAKRARVGEVLEKSARSLLMWVAGDAISMATIFTVSWIGLSLIGMNNAFLLALQAGLLAFIPTLGPFVAGVIIVLAALAQGPEMALWALGVYVLIQGVESNVTQPIAQRMTTSLPPALTLGAQMLFGLLFGLPGFILAVPLMAVLVTMVRELYVKDVLGGAAGQLAEDGSS